MRFSPKTIGTAAAVTTVVIWTAFIVIARASADPSRGATLTPFDIALLRILGASAVLVGRPYVYGLANAGAHGVAHVLRLLRDELEIAMALTGCRTLADAGPDLLQASP